MQKRKKVSKKERKERRKEERKGEGNKGIKIKLKKQML